jgi:cell division protein FtsI/penicillin-binding protein 2
MSQRPPTLETRQRVKPLFFVFVLFVGLIGYRVVSVQVVRSGEFSQWAKAERMQENIVSARRGEIFDARGVRLATNVPANRVSAILDQVADKHLAAEQLAPLIDRPAGEIEDALSQPDLEWVTLARHISPELSGQIEGLNLDGIVLDPEPSRVYPFGAFASQLLGFTNDDLQGNYGIEGEYNDILDGTPGKLIGERDAAGNVIGLTQSTWDSPVDGADIVLTLDSAVQQAIEQILDEVVSEHHALGGTILVQDTQTGAILGIANRATYDPNDYGDVTDPSVYLNPAISTIYEPGSTFKSIVMAIGIDSGAVTPDTIFNDAPGYVALADGSKIRNFENEVFGDISMRQVLQYSSNLGAIYVAEQIGEQRFYQSLQDFGFGVATGVDLQGEEAGILTLPNEAGWNDALQYTNAFGQGIACTPLQLVNAFSSIVNGGRLMQPYIVSEIHDGDNVTTTQPTQLRQVISPESSATMREMLESVVHYDGSLYSKVPGYRIGAKTGTAQVPSPDGGYIEDATIASIVGFGPVADPRFTVLVKIDQPQKGETGLAVSSPALTKVFEQLFMLYGIPPTEPEEVP